MNELIKQLLGWKTAAEEMDQRFNRPGEQPKVKSKPRAVTPKPVHPRTAELQAETARRKAAKAAQQRKAAATEKSRRKPWYKKNLYDLFRW